MPQHFLNTSHENVEWFAERAEAGRLNLRPSFQRRPVWTDEEKSFLIDSVLRGYPIPEIYVYTYRPENRTNDVTAVVDGQQRLRAFLEYMSDDYPISFDTNKLRPLFTLEETRWFGKRFSQLGQDDRDALTRYKLIVRELEGVTEPELRHMFHRLNQANFVLNAQELRYSIYQDGLLSCVEALVKLKQWEEIGLFTLPQRRRMLDSEFISELVIGYLHWPQNKKDDLEHYYRQYAVEFPFSSEVVRLFQEVLNYLLLLFPKRKMSGTRWYRKSDFYTLFLAFARGRIPMSNDSAEELRGALTMFSALVSGDEFEGDAGPIGTYKDAVTRAASDRGRRIRREDALVAYLANPAVSSFETVPADAIDEDDVFEEDGEYEDADVDS